MRSLSLTAELSNAGDVVLVAAAWAGELRRHAFLEVKRRWDEIGHSDHNMWARVIDTDFIVV